MDFFKIKWEKNFNLVLKSFFVKENNIIRNLSWHISRGKHYTMSRETMKSNKLKDQILLFVHFNVAICILRVQLEMAVTLGWNRKQKRLRI